MAETSPSLLQTDKTFRQNDARAAFVLQSKGEWWHARFHLHGGDCWAKRFDFLYAAFEGWVGDLGFFA
uniref:Uncharacterized protein n=1 Tax=Cannabis sativa TaxID=3483 RepID=A0A803QDU1_CANSA